VRARCHADVRALPKAPIYYPVVDFRRLLDEVGADHGAGVNLDAVRSAEHELGPFPDDYRDFLGQVGWATLRAQEVAGLGDDVPHRWQNVVDLTRQERLDGGLPGHLIAVHPDGGGNFACLDQQQLVLWYHDGPSEVRPDGFTPWLVDLLGRA
jgi:hypothetical protein